MLVQEANDTSINYIVTVCQLIFLPQSIMVFTFWYVLELALSTSSFFICPSLLISASDIFQRFPSPSMSVQKGGGGNCTFYFEICRQEVVVGKGWSANCRFVVVLSSQLISWLACFPHKSNICCRGGGEVRFFLLDLLLFSKKAASFVFSIVSVLKLFPAALKPATLMLATYAWLARQCRQIQIIYLFGV